MPKEFHLPAEREAPSDVPPLAAGERYGFAVRLTCLFGIVALFVAVFWYMRSSNTL